MIKPYESWDDDWHTLLWVCDTKEESAIAFTYAKKIASYHPEAKVRRRYESNRWIIKVTFLDL